jgi:hypothetical protein
MKNTLSVQALVVAIIVVPSALAAETPASTTNASLPGPESSQRFADHYRNLRDVARIAVSNAPPGIEAKSPTTNTAASAGQPEPGSPFVSGQITNKAARREAAGRQGSPLDRGPLGIMKSSVSLSDEQVRKLEPVFKEQQDKINALRRDASLSRKDRVGKWKEIQQGTDAKIKPLLTAEQAEKWQKTRLTQQPSVQQQGQAATNASPYSVWGQAEKGQQPKPNWQSRIQQPQQPQPQPQSPQEATPK